MAMTVVGHTLKALAGGTPPNFQKPPRLIGGILNPHNPILIIKAPTLEYVVCKALNPKSSRSCGPLP